MASGRDGGETAGTVVREDGWTTSVRPAAAGRVVVGVLAVAAAGCDSEPAPRNDGGRMPAILAV